MLYIFGASFLLKDSMGFKKKYILAVATAVMTIFVGLVITVLYFVVDDVVANRTINSVSELASHDKNAISGVIDYNWNTLERIAKKLRRNASTLTDKRKIYEYLSDEANESIFDNVFLIKADGSYYTDITYREPGTPDYYDYTVMFDGELEKAVKFDSLPYIKGEKAVVYGYRLNDDFDDIEIDGGVHVFAVVGVCMRQSIKDGLVIESFLDERGNHRGYSSVVTIDGEYVVNRADDANADAYNWFTHIESGKSDIDKDKARGHMLANEPFWFFLNYGSTRELNYCVPLDGTVDWYFLLTIDNEVLTEQTKLFVGITVIAFVVMILIVVGAVIFISVSRRKQERALLREKVQSEFLANMSHEIRTPLNGIVGLNYLMMSSINDPDKHEQLKSWLSKSNSAAKYLLSLVNDVLDVSKLRAGKMDVVHEPTVIDGVVDAIYSMQGDNIKNRGVEFIKDAEISVPCVLSDEVRMKQLLMNIVSNAAKFTPYGGQIRFSVRQRIIDEKHVETTFVCEDTGCGMSKEFMTKIFDVFTQDRNSNKTSVKGTGLGMFITKMIVDAMGGTISVDSEIGKGSKFTVVIPAEIANTHEYIISSVDAEAERLAQPDLFDIKQRKVLVAEDNELNAEILLEILDEAGFNTVHAENGEKALDIFKKSQVGEFSLILMDVRMPVLDGYGASAAIRALDRPDAKSVLIFACTANTFIEDRIKAAESGMNDFLSKPVDIKLLLQKIGSPDISYKPENGGAE